MNSHRVAPSMFFALLTFWTVLLPGCGPETPPTEEANDSPTGNLGEHDRAALEALRYINTVPVAKEEKKLSGVTRYDQAQAFDGVNLFNPRHESEAYLMDMGGEIRHRWRSTIKGDTYQQFQTRFPSLKPTYLDGWNHVSMLSNGASSSSEPTICFCG